jgi:hypothetical protein
LKSLIEAKIMTDGDEKYLHGFPKMFSDANKVEDINTRRELPEKQDRFVVRNFYESLFDQMFESIQKPEIKRIYLTGTPGVGKSTFRNYFAWQLVQKFKQEKKALRVAMHKGGKDEFKVMCLEADGAYCVQQWDSKLLGSKNLLQPEFTLGRNFFCLSDVSKGNSDCCDEMDGGSFIFSSPNCKTWQQGDKAGSQTFFLPLWEEKELCRFDTEEKLFAIRFLKYGGLVRYVWGSDTDCETHESKRLNKETDFRTLNTELLLRDWAGACFPHRYVYLHVKREGEVYQFTETPELSIGTRHIARKLAEKYVEELLETTEPQWGMDHPPVYGLLFEAVALKLLSSYSDKLRIEIRNLKKMSNSRNIKPPFISGKKHPWQFTMPPNLNIVEFNAENDVLKVMNGSLVNGPGFGYPKSTTFAGFDAVLVFVINGKKVCFLFQATMAKIHPLSQGGAHVLMQFVEAGYKVYVVYIVPTNSKDFKRRELKKDVKCAGWKKIPQYCMTLDVYSSNKKQKTN